MAAAKRTLTELNSAGQWLSAQASHIYLYSVNPALGDDMLNNEVPRFNDAERTQPTVTYSVSRDPTSATEWPQIPVTFFTVGAAGVRTDVTIDIPLKMPNSQFVSILRPELCGRMIRSFKNQGAQFWAYNVLSSEGLTTWTVACNPDIPVTTKLEVGGMVADTGATILGIMAADATNDVGIFNDAVFQSGGVGETTMANFFNNVVNKDGKYSTSWYDENLSEVYVYADKNAMGSENDFAAGGNETSGGGGIGATTTPAEAGALITGCYVFYLVVPPHIPASDGTHGPTLAHQGVTFCVSIYGNNEGKEYLAATLPGFIVGTDLVDYVSSDFCVWPVDQDDYYRFEITAYLVGYATASNAAGYLPVTVDSGAAGASFQMEIGIAYVGNGEGWSHLMTPQVEGEFPVIIDDNAIATTELIVNGTNLQNIGGFVVAHQPSNDTYWQTYADNGNPFQHITEFLHRPPIGFKNGCYTALKMTPHDYQLRKEIFQPSSFNSGTSATFQCRLNNVPFAITCVSNQANLGVGSTPTNFVQQTIFDGRFAGEHTTNSMWRRPKVTQFSEAAWREFNSMIKTQDLFSSNNTHNYKTLLASGISKGISGLNSVAEWIPKIAGVARAVLPYLA